MRRPDPRKSPHCPISLRAVRFRHRTASHYRNMITSILALWLAAASPPGIQKFEQVNEHLYRGAQPAEQGFRALAKMGIRTVVDLRDRAAQSHWEKQVVESLGMRFVVVPMSMHAPT